MHYSNNKDTADQDRGQQAYRLVHPIVIMVCSHYNNMLFTGPHSPTVLVDVTYRPSMLPQVTAIVTGHPLWNGYEITEYRVNVTNGSDGSLLDQITVPNDPNRNNSVSMNVNQSLFESTTQNCYSLIFSGSTVSSLYDGVSESTQFRAAMFRGK